jgi:hypothetical protein
MPVPPSRSVSVYGPCSPSSPANCMRWNSPCALAAAAEPRNAPLVHSPRTPCTRRSSRPNSPAVNVSGTSPRLAARCGALSSMSTRSSDCRSCVLPAADSGRLRSVSTPVSSTPGASVPLTARSSDWRSAASCDEPNSTATVLLPVTASAAPPGGCARSRPVDGRATAAAAPVSAGAGPAGVTCGAGAYTWRANDCGGGSTSQHVRTHSDSPGARSVSTRRSPRSGSIR